MKKVFVILAPGFELIEALTPVDVLKRCGLDVITLSIGDSLEVESSMKNKIIADKMFSSSEALEGDMIILPGGYPGFVNIGEHPELMKTVNAYLNAGRLIGAICGAPSALAINGLIDGRKVVAHSSVKELMKTCKIQDSKVFRDENIITAVGAGVSLEFAFELAKSLVSQEIIKNAKKGMELL